MKPYNLSKKEKDAFYGLFGLMLGLASRHLLTEVGMDVDYKINGEPIEDIQKLGYVDLDTRLKLAIEEERYEDAAKLKKLIDLKKKNP